MIFFLLFRPFSFCAGRGKGNQRRTMAAVDALVAAGTKFTAAGTRATRRRSNIEEANGQKPSGSDRFLSLYLGLQHR